MTEQEVRVQQRRSRESPSASAEPEPPTFADAIRFLHRRRVALLARFGMFAALGLIAFAVWLWSTPRKVEGRLVLSFAGIEKGEYPSGRKFGPSDFRAPEVLNGALADAGISGGKAVLSRASARLDTLPIIPVGVLSRWKRADRDGTKREDYSPSEFDLTLTVPGLSAEEQVRLFDAIVKRYQDKVKFDESAALNFASDWSGASYQDLVNKYDYWDIPYILDQNVDLLNGYLKQLVDQSEGFKDPISKFSFRDIQKEFTIWSMTRLEALKGVTYRGRLVKNKETQLLASQYRLEDLEIQSRRRAEETAEAMSLLEASQKPQGMSATQAATREGLPIVDASVLDRLVRSDYLGPLVKHISELQEQTARLQAQKRRLEKDIALLPQAHDVSPAELPAGYRDLVATVSGELGKIIQNYNSLLDRYLTTTVSKLVVVKDGPRLTHGTSALVFLAGMMFLAAGLAVFAVIVQHIVRTSLRRE
jgi:hypothetical protein